MINLLLYLVSNLSSVTKRIVEYEMDIVLFLSWTRTLNETELISMIQNLELVTRILSPEIQVSYYNESHVMLLVK